MNFALALYNSGATWKIAPTKHRFLTGREMQDDLTTGRRVPLTDTTKVPEQDATRVDVFFKKGKRITRYFKSHLVSSEHNLNTLLVLTLKEHRFDKRVKGLLDEWFLSKGNGPVNVVVDEDDVSSAMHTGLRKLADSKTSSITWNAIHQLSPDDKTIFWNGCRIAFRRFMDPLELRASKLTRRTAAVILKEEVLKTIESLIYLDKPNSYAYSLTRTEATAAAARRYVLISFKCACEMTEDSEWQHGWLGYVLKDIDE